jgi:uncharacterized protein DUF2878
MSLTVVLNFVFFQMLWFSCVVGAGAYGLAWLALGSLLPIGVLTWFSQTRTADLAVATLALCIGLVIDNLWVTLDILSYPQNSYAPYWIAVLWVGLGLTVNHSMALFRDHTLIGSVVVGLAAPVTYLAGQRFGSVTVNDLYLTPVISLAWFVVFYGLAKFALWMVDRQGDPLGGRGQIEAATSEKPL